MQNTAPMPGRMYLSNKRNRSNGGRNSLYESLEKTLRTRLEELQRHVSQHRGEKQIDDEVDGDATHAIRSTNRDINRDLARKAMLRLSPVLRGAFFLREGEGWTHQEMATALGITLKAGKSRVHRARRKLREELKLLT